jgi:hypothetical protein
MKNSNFNFKKAEKNCAMKKGDALMLRASQRRTRDVYPSKQSHLHSKKYIADIFFVLLKISQPSKTV